MERDCFYNEIKYVRDYACKAAGLDPEIAGWKTAVDAMTKQLADAQATVEALQRERDEARDFLNTVTNDLNEQAGELSQLQALMRALPVAIAIHVDCSIERYVRYCTSEKLNYECAFPSKEYAQAFVKLLEYRVSLDATTPARPRCEQCNRLLIHEAHADTCTYILAKPKGGNGE